MIKYIINKNTFTFSLCILSIAALQVLALQSAFILRGILDAAADLSKPTLLLYIKYSILYMVVYLIVEYVQRIAYVRLKRRFLQRLKNDLMQGILSIELEEFMEKNSASFISILNNDVRSVETDYFDTLFSIASSFFCFAFAILFLSRISPVITMISVAFGIFAFFIPVFFSHMVSRTRLQYLSGMERYTEKIKDIFSGIEIINVFKLITNMINIHREVNSNVESARYKYEMANTHVHIHSVVFSITMQLSIFILAGYFVISNGMTVGVMVAALQLCAMTVDPIRTITQGITKITSLKPVIEKMEMIAAGSERIDAPRKEVAFTDSVGMENVSYSVNDTFSISNISLKIEKGKKYAIVGESGSGKSTLVKLLLGYHKDYDGDIKIDGASVKGISSASLYSIMSIIHQDVFVFDDSLLNNITLYNQYPPEAINRVIESSGLSRLVDNAEQASKYVLAENGKNLSGGEKQRVAIARAFLAQTEILIMDEATASLDTSTAYQIENDILQMKDLTCVTITHRLHRELLSKYDTICVMKDGRIVERGTFDELMKKSGYLYSMLYITGA